MPLLAGLLLLTVAFAGCAGDQGPGTDGADGGEAVSQEQARSSYLSAVSVFDEGPSDVGRVGMEMTFEAKNGTEDGTGTVKALFDGEQNLSIMSMSGTFAEGAGSTGMQSGEIEVFVAGQVHKTNFFGVPPSMMGFYNETAEPPEGFTSIDSSPDAGPSGSSASGGPTAFMENLGQAPPPGTQFMATETTYNGEDALEIETTYEENGTSYDVRAVVYTDPSRPALFEGDVTGGQAATSSDAGSFKVEFTYGEDATHEQEEGLVRLESMTFSSGEPSGGFMTGSSGGDERFTNRTIQPSQNPGLVPLEELEVQVTSGGSSGPGGGMSADDDASASVLTLPAEEGSAENENVRVTYDDADGDGAVSPGDEIVLEDLDPEDNETFSLQLHDEVTGLNLTPSPSVVALVGLVSLVALAARRHRA